jgi:CubicO group peptidase (beta-lactamase class C family)
MDGQTPSIAVGLIRNGALVWAEGFGWADREKKVPATADTIYWLASVSKPITATGLMQLVERGAIDLDRPANAYLGDAKLRAYVGSADAMTVRRLANHTAGMPTHATFFHGGQPPPMDESIRRYGFASLEPGKQVQYSNFAYGVLGYIVQRVAKMPWREYQEKHVYDPLRMSRTSDRIRPGFERDEAIPYVTDIGGRFMRYARYDFDHRPASAIYSSVNDLSRFIRMHLNGGELDGVRVLSAASVKEMQRITGEMRPGAGYGVAWQSLNLGGHAGLTHSGSMPGVATLISMFPAERAATIVLMNGDNRQLGADVTRSLAQLLFSDIPPAGDGAVQTPASPSRPPPAPPSAAMAGTWTGRLVHYEGDIAVRLTINGDGSIDAAFGSRPAERLTDTTVSATGITGRLDVIFHTQESYDGVSNLRLALSLRDGKLAGVATAFAPFFHTLPYWMELERAGSQ